MNDFHNDTVLHRQIYRRKLLLSNYIICIVMNFAKHIFDFCL